MNCAPRIAWNADTTGAIVQPGTISISAASKPEGHFTSSPAGYFHGMVAKAKAGELNLARTVWGLRSGGKPGAGKGRGGRPATAPFLS
jgi:hypothetical protein